MEMRDSVNPSPRPGLKALHLAAFLSALLLLIRFLTGGRRLGCKPGPQDVHPQEVESTPRSLQNTRGSKLRHCGGSLGSSGRLVLQGKLKELENIYRLGQMH